MFDLCVSVHIYWCRAERVFISSMFPPRVCYIDPSAEMVTWQPLVSVNHLWHPTVKYLSVYSGPLFMIRNQRTCWPSEQLFASGKNNFVKVEAFLSIAEIILSLDSWCKEGKGHHKQLIARAEKHYWSIHLTAKNVFRHWIKFACHRQSCC